MELGADTRVLAVGRRALLPVTGGVSSLRGIGKPALILGAGALALAVAFAAVSKLGLLGLLVPAALVVGGMLFLRPLALTAFLVALVVLVEGPRFGLFSVASHIYSRATVMDTLGGVAVLSVALGTVLAGRRMSVPRVIAVPLTVLALAMIVGLVMAHSAGVGLSTSLRAESSLAFLVLLPIAVANLDLDSRRLRVVMRGALALALLKAVLGLIEVAGHYGSPIEGHASVTYYEPTANWLMMVALLWIVASSVLGKRPSRWTLLSAALLVASLALSYRRSFWIATVLGVLLVLLIGLSPMNRRLFLSAILMVTAAIWLLGSVHFESQVPIVKRVESLAPSKVEANREDIYRLDESANVLGTIARAPLTGLGVEVPWNATTRPLSVEHEGGRLYVHFAALWYWLKLGILGLVAYVSLLCGAAILSWRVWRRSHEPAVQAFGLASLCALAGLIVIETTASFTGVDVRFTILLAAQIGLLALLARRSTVPDQGASNSLSASIE
jgi:O-antigen ligase